MSEALHCEHGANIRQIRKVFEVERDAAWTRFHDLLEMNADVHVLRYHMEVWLSMDDSVRALGEAEHELYSLPQLPRVRYGILKAA